MLIQGVTIFRFWSSKTWSSQLQFSLPACIHTSYGFDWAITITFKDGFRNNLALLSLMSRSAIWNSCSGRLKGQGETWRSNKKMVVNWAFSWSHFFYIFMYFKILLQNCSPWWVELSFETFRLNIFYCIKTKGSDTSYNNIRTFVWVSPR